MADVYGVWRARLRGETPAASAHLPTHHANETHENPQAGLWRTRLAKGGPLVPVRIWLVDHNGTASHVWRDGLKLSGTINGAPVTPDQLADRWIWCQPVPKDDMAHYDAHQRWPGEVDLDTPRANSVHLTPLEALRDYLETAKAWLASKKVTDETSANEAGNIAGELSRLKGVADKERDGKVRPHLEAQREINGEYNPAINDADVVVKAIKRASDAWVIAEKNRREAEARAKYEAEQRAVLAARKAAEEQRAKLMRDDPIEALTMTQDLDGPVMPPPPTPVKVNIGGQRGKKLGLRTVTEHAVTDYDKVYAWAKEHPAVVEAVTKAAIAAARAGEVVPGVTARQVEKVA